MQSSETKPFLIQRNQHFDFFIFPFLLFFLFSLTCFSFFAVGQYDRRCWKTLLMSERHWKLTNIACILTKLRNRCCGSKSCVRETKVFLTSGKNSFCFRAAKFVSATYVSRAAKLGNICIRHNVS